MSFDPVKYWETRFSGGVSLGTVGWLGLGESFNTWMYRVRGALFLREARRFVVPGARVLDIGSGTGFYLDRWRDFGAAEIYGSDLTDAATSALARTHPGHMVKLDIGAPSIDVAERFDAISAMDVLFHIVDDERYARSFRNIASLLKPDGILIFSDNFLHHKTVRSAHQVSRTLAETEAAVRAAGFEILERRPAFVLMNAPVDSHSRALHFYWAVLRRVAGSSAFAGHASGALLYAIELALTRLLPEGPSTELMVCRIGSQAT